MADQKFVKDWIKDLRSGKYEQWREGGFGSGSLSSPAYCCLGLAMEITTGGGELIEKKVPELSTYRFKNPADRSRGGGDRRTLWTHLVNMNDGRGIYKGKAKSFPEIADILEEILVENANT